MEQTLHALGGILLKAIPTVVIVLLLHFYLKSMLFKPLEKVLKLRDEATGGARKAAQASLEAADAKAAQHDTALRDARAQVYLDQEQIRARLTAEQDAHLQESRLQMKEKIQQAQAEIDAQTAAARSSLDTETSTLADQISSAILTGKAA